MAINTEGRRHRPVRSFAVVMLVCAVLGGIAGALIGATADMGLSNGLTVGVTLSIAIAVAFFLCVWWWRQLDEAAQEAHKWAWWWGGSAGMAVGLVLMGIGMKGLNAGWLDARVIGSDPAELLYRGAMGMLVCQMLGYGVAWAAWWLRRR